MDDVKRNGSGYYDETAYKAIRNLEGAKEMERGEIWEVDENGKIRMALVVFADTTFCTTLVLQEEQNHSKKIPVLARNMMYVDPAMLTFKFNKHFVNFVRKLKDDEFIQVMREICERIEIPVCDASEIDELKSLYEREKQICDDLQRELVEYADNCEALEVKMQEAHAEIRQLKEAKEFKDDRCEEVSELTAKTAVELARVEAERDLYKKMYEKLLDKLIER